MDLRPGSLVKIDLLRFCTVICTMVGTTYFVSNKIRDVKDSINQIGLEVTTVKHRVDSIESALALKVTPLTLKVYGDNLQKLNPTLRVPEIPVVLEEAAAYSRLKAPSN